MPILMLALVAVAVFLVMGLLLFSATIAERRDRELRDATSKQPSEEKKIKAAAR